MREDGWDNVLVGMGGTEKEKGLVELRLGKWVGVERGTKIGGSIKQRVWVCCLEGLPQLGQGNGVWLGLGSSEGFEGCHRDKCVAAMRMDKVRWKLVREKRGEGWVSLISSKGSQSCLQ